MADTRARGGSGALLIFAVSSLAAVGLGTFISASSDVPTGSWLRNLVAWGVGLLLAVGLAMTTPGRRVVIVPWIGAAALLVTLFNPDQDGVHRWIDIGPLHINVAMVVLPATAVALASAAPRWTAWLPAFLMLGLLVLQPDASQAAALAGVMAWITITRVSGMTTRTGLIAGAVLLAAIACGRPDPLLPVPEVEGIVGLAFGLSPWLGGLALVTLATVAALPAALTLPVPGTRLAGQALSLCLVLWALSPLFGAFPVPLVGIGMSPILGAWLGMGLLCAQMRSGAASPTPR
ncbi:hypothetical protein MMB232_02706 [Brevundimonas subvibrioides]|uniref:hypothetical protein n=1 Tax=Brevundimonas subvibrioides TaxID=74313 RepID=UPI0032D58E53